MAKKRITQEQFDAVKALAEIGLKTKKIAQALNLGNTTIVYLKRFDTLEQYHNFNKERHIKTHIKEKEVAQKSDVSPHQSEVSKLPVSIANEERAITSIAELADAINRLADAFKRDTPIEKSAREYKLFSRR